jgi:hypothetical protein
MVHSIHLIWWNKKKKRSKCFLTEGDSETPSKHATEDIKVVWTRVTPDGRREAKIDDEIIEILHEHEIASPALFPGTCRRAFWVNPRYLSVGASDVEYAYAELLIAGAKDIESIMENTGSIAEKPLSDSISALRAAALKIVGSDVLQRIDEQMLEQLLSSAKEELGPENWANYVEKFLGRKGDEDMYSGRENDEEKVEVLEEDAKRMRVAWLSRIRAVVENNRHRAVEDALSKLDETGWITSEGEGGGEGGARWIFAVEHALIEQLTAVDPPRDVEDTCNRLRDWLALHLPDAIDNVIGEFRHTLVSARV